MITEILYDFFIQLMMISAWVSFGINVIRVVLPYDDNTKILIDATYLNDRIAYHHNMLNFYQNNKNSKSNHS